MAERLHKVLADRGVASRRKAEDMIAAGRVTVNGEVAHVGQSAELSDDIHVDGVRVAVKSERVYVALNKPTGVVSAASTSRDEATVTDLVSLPERVYPVGRLDKDSSGLIFLTNDGAWSLLVTHPRYGVDKEYDVLVRGRLSADELAALESGITLPDGSITAPARIFQRSSMHAHSRVSVTVIEGKKRQIRLMFAAVGHPVDELRRVRIGPIELGGLVAGAWRLLSEEEVARVRRSASESASESAPMRTPSGARRARVGR